MIVLAALLCLMAQVPAPAGSLETWVPLKSFTKPPAAFPAIGHGGFSADIDLDDGRMAVAAPDAWEYLFGVTDWGFAYLTHPFGPEPLHLVKHFVPDDAYGAPLLVEDGALVVSGWFGSDFGGSAYTGMVDVFDAATGQHLRTIGPSGMDVCYSAWNFGRVLDVEDGILLAGTRVQCEVDEKDPAFLIDLATGLLVTPPLMMPPPAPFGNVEPLGMHGDDALLAGGRAYVLGDALFFGDWVQCVYVFDAETGAHLTALFHPLPLDPTLWTAAGPSWKLPRLRLAWAEGKLVVGQADYEPWPDATPGALLVFDAETFVLEHFVVAAAEGLPAGLGFAIDVDGDRLMAGSSQGALIFDTHTWNHVATLGDNEVTALALDGDLAAVLDADGVATTWARERTSPWSEVAAGLAGGLGAAPVLTVESFLGPGDPGVFVLSQALPLSPVWLVLGAPFLGAPYQGGVLGPVPELVVWTVSLSDGSGLVPFSVPGDLPVGAGFHVQAWVGAPFGLSATPTLLLHVQ